jgi:hypothetical protein
VEGENSPEGPRNKGRRRPLTLTPWGRILARAASSGAPGFPASPVARVPPATLPFIPPTLQERACLQG